MADAPPQEIADALGNQQENVTVASQNLPILQPAVRHISLLESDNWADNLPATDHVRFFRTTDWAATHLGRLNHFSIALRLHIFTVFADSRAACLYWGPERVAIYNEAFVPLAAKAHPRLMGKPFYDGFPEIWQHIKPVFDLAESTGIATDVNEMEMFVERNGYVEETYFTGNFTPLRGCSGAIEGFYNAVHEITKAKIDDRRRTMLNNMEVPTHTDHRMAYHIIPVLETNNRDIPLALIYKVDEESFPETTKLMLKGRIGIPDGHPLAIETLDLNGNEGITPLLRKARWSTITVPVDDRFNNVEWQGFGEPSRFVSIIPILGPNRLFGFAVIGSNPRRGIDEDHHQFIRDLSAKLSSIAASILSAEETKKREERLQRQLADSVQRMRYMAENASIGMQYISIQGKIEWANDEYYRVTGHPRAEELQRPLSFLDTYTSTDRPKAVEVWERLIQGESSISVELHLKKEYIPPIGDPEPACVVAHSFRVVEDGKLKSIMIFTTDISAFKWAEASEARKAAEASDAKKKQEEFIDLVSHELRNPLSAVFQLADTIINSFPKYQDSDAPRLELVNALRNNVENASTILMCAKHQKRIVDDVLTLSKLEYTMLSIVPRAVQLSVLVKRSVKMFEQEFLSHDIHVQTIADSSMEANGVDWVLCDESRVQQILINLLTNSIKFTKLESKRELEVKFGAYITEPRKAFPQAIHWAPNKASMDDLTLNPEWGLGQHLYLTFSVRDTGVGMTEEEIMKLFNRFEQANKRTSIRYGGSGLGLFVSQKLAEKQNGEIGVVSQSNEGSTFAFYIKSRRTKKDTGTVGQLTEFKRPSPPLRSISTPGDNDMPTVDLNKMHVLLVEDNLVNQRVVARQLKVAGCIVSLANHGVEALEALRESDTWYENPNGVDQKHIDIILMDWEMPIMDGLTCSREIRKLQRAGKITRHLEILATTANARPEQIEMALESGIDSVMVKPFLIKDLLERMREMLGTSMKRIAVPRSTSSP